MRVRVMRLKLSFGEIAAAWVCCGVLAGGALLVGSGGARDDPAAAAYAGAHIPGTGGRQLSRGSDVEEEPDRNSLAELDATSEKTEPMVAIGSAETPTIVEPTQGQRSANRHCRYALRQSLRRYSAAARLADAGAASGVREASQ